MRRRTIVVAAIMVAAIVIVGAYAAAVAFGGNQKTEYLVAQVYITSWNSNITMMNLVDVQFKISLDLNNDNTFELQQYSDVLNNTYLETAPFKLGGPVTSSVGHFNFKVEVFKVVNGIQIPMNYTQDGKVPVNSVSATESSEDSWSYDATALRSFDDYSCGISYMYFVS
jgi:hypothetical protein